MLDGLSTETLNSAQIQNDWDGRLLYQSGRLAFYARHYEESVQALQKAAAIIAAKDPDGHISEASIRQLIAYAGQQR